MAGKLLPSPLIDQHMPAAGRRFGCIRSISFLCAKSDVHLLDAAVPPMTSCNGARIALGFSTSHGSTDGSAETTRLLVTSQLCDKLTRTNPPKK